MEQTARVLSQLGSKEQPSKGFQSLIRQIGEAKTKHEEDRIIRKEATLLKDRVGARDVTPRQMREYLIRLIYCEMLGAECSWGYIHAVKFTQTSTTLDKRIGYLAASLFLHEGHELNVLLVATLQKDLKSSNMLEVSMALIFICKLVGADMIPPLLPLVQDKLLHPKQLVRKKAVMAMHRFFLLSPDSVTHLNDDFRRSLSDQDPGVMEASLLLFHDLIKSDPAKYKDLTESFVDILSQVVDRKLPQEFNYHGVPAPWIQMRLLRILALLGADDLKMSEKVYAVIDNVLASAECNSDVGQGSKFTNCCCFVCQPVH
jgi:AP-4 complex subunit epsilon-1